MEIMSPAAGRSNFRIGKWILVTSKIVFLLTSCYANENDREDEFCAMEASLDLTHASENASGFLDGSGSFFPREATRLRAGVRHGCICDIKPCLAHCPKSGITRAGSTYDADDSANYSAIPRVYTTNLTLDNDEEIAASEQWFHMVKWNPCSSGGYFLDPKMYPGDEFYLLRNGSLFIPQGKKVEARFKDFRTSCLRLKDNDSTYTPIICARKVEDSFNTVTYIGSLVAVPFLIATVIVYSILPELDNIHGTTIRCHLCCLILAYLALAASRIIRPYHVTVSRCFGFASSFSFTSSFFWLNVMSFDIWWKFGGCGSLQKSCANQDRKKFIYYSIYAWGFGVVLTAICIATEEFPSIPQSIGLESAKVIYFSGPVGLTIVCNVCLFISTIVKIVHHDKKVRQQLSNEDSKCHDDHKHWFGLHLKLFVVMGITWSSEIISDFWKSPKLLWDVMDMLNVLQGILIFVIFVCKKSIWLSLRKRFDRTQSRTSDHQLLSCICIPRNLLSVSKATAYSDARKSPFSSSKYGSTRTQIGTLD